MSTTPSLNPEARSWRMALPRMAPARPRPERARHLIEAGSRRRARNRGRRVELAMMAVLLLSSVALAGMAVWAVSPRAGLIGGDWDVPGGRILLFRPSAAWSDYWLEVSLGPREPRRAWVFRVKDEANYYAEIAERVAPGALRMTHYSMVGGRESSRVVRMATLPEDPAEVALRFRVKGAEFSAFVGERLIDNWSDRRLRDGGAGVLRESREQSLEALRRGVRFVAARL